MLVSNILTAFFLIALGFYIKFNPEKVMNTLNEAHKKKVDIKGLNTFFFYTSLLMGFSLLCISIVFYLLRVNIYYHIIVSASVFILMFAFIIVAQIKYYKK